MEAGKCVVTVLMKDHYDFLKWKHYVDPSRQWDFEVAYPAYLRAEFEFHTTMDVEYLTKKIVQMLEMGFDVHTAGWKLVDAQTKSQQKQLLK